jgi:tetratricopeptide (TPR) repeat protein
MTNQKNSLLRWRNVLFLLLCGACVIMAAAMIQRNLQAVDALKGLMNTSGNHTVGVVADDSDIVVQGAEQDDSMLRIYHLRMLERKGDWVGAVNAADQLCDSAQRMDVCTWLRVQTYESAGVELQDQGELKQKTIEALGETGLSNSDSWRYGRDAASRGRSTEAASWLKRTTLIQPKTARDYFTLGLAFIELNQLTDAMASLDKALQTGFPQRDVLFYKAAVHEKSGEVNDAAIAYRAAAEADAHDAIGRSDALFANGWLMIYSVRPPNDEVAVHLFEQSAAVNDFIKGRNGLASAFFQLGHAYTRLGDYLNAEKNYKSAIRLIPESSDYRVSLGALLINSGRMDEGLASLNDALAIHPSNVEALLVMGDYHRKQGAVSQARAMYAQVLEIDAGNERAINALNQLK